MSDRHTEREQYLAKTAYMNVLDLREQYLISRALCSLERELDRVQGIHKEQSDLADVRRLIKAFPMWKAIEEVTR